MWIFRSLRRVKGTAGASGLTNGLVIGLIAVVAVTAVQDVGGRVNVLFDRVGDRMGAALDGRPLNPTDDDGRDTTDGADQPDDEPDDEPDPDEWARIYLADDSNDPSLGYVDAAVSAQATEFLVGYLDDQGDGDPANDQLLAATFFLAPTAVWDLNADIDWRQNSPLRVGLSGGGEARVSVQAALLGTTAISTLDDLSPSGLGAVTLRYSARSYTGLACDDPANVNFFGILCFDGMIGAPFFTAFTATSGGYGGSSICSEIPANNRFDNPQINCSDRRLFAIYAR